MAKTWHELPIGSKEAPKSRNGSIEYLVGQHLYAD